MISAGTISFLDVNGALAFTSGILSFFSPCVLPLIPSYLIYISGITLDNYNETELKKYRMVVLTHALAFILGFSFVFVSMGISSSFIGGLLASYQTYISLIGGLLLIVMGIFCLGVINLPFLNYEKIVHLRKKPAGLFGSFVVGVTFSLGWTPCVGPALSSILVMASTADSVLEGVYLLGLYSAGLGLPFIIAALLFDRLFAVMRRITPVVRYTMKVLGVLLILIGLLLVTGYYRILGLWLSALFPVV